MTTLRDVDDHDLLQEISRRFERTNWIRGVRASEDAAWQEAAELRALVEQLQHEVHVRTEEVNELKRAYDDLRKTTAAEKLVRT